MKIALFDTVNELHVCQALESALKASGHDVVATGPVWQGHRFAAGTAELAAIDRKIDEVIAQGCDALFNFRASALNVGQVRRLRDAGVRCAVWLPDDPVLYHVTYAAIVDAYDHVLHCASASVLEFYDRRGHRPGVNFPFWLDPGRWAAAWSPEAACDRLVFMGNLHVSAKRSRYQRLAPASGRLAVYGKCASDPAGIHRGELYGVEAIASVLPGYAAGVNISQQFSEYAQTEYDFRGLASLGGFDLPSRVTQYAALGMPVVSLGAESASGQFPWATVVEDAAAAVRAVDAMLLEKEETRAAAAAARQAIERHFSGAARSEFLGRLFWGQIDVGAMTPDERERAYMSFTGTHQ